MAERLMFIMMHAKIRLCQRKQTFCCKEHIELYQNSSGKFYYSRGQALYKHMKSSTTMIRLKSKKPV